VGARRKRLAQLKVGCIGKEAAFFTKKAIRLGLIINTNFFIFLLLLKKHKILCVFNKIRMIKQIKNIIIIFN